jgi:hypothetical protein
MKLPKARFARVLALLALALPALAAAAAQGADGAAPRPDAGAAAEADLPEGLDAVSGRILKVTREEIVVQKGFARRDAKPTLLRVHGGAAVDVSGAKSTWFELRRGDLVTVAFSREARKGEEEARLARKVVVLPPETDPAYAAALGKATPRQKHNVRRFVGWIKKIDADGMVVRQPDLPGGRDGEARDFVRTDATSVDHLRDSWDALQKGDRVIVVFGKGRPRPAEQVSVILRGGEKPLPPGLATRLFDPRYDETVKDVDGIGEVPPGTPWPPQKESAKGAQGS